MKLVPGLELSDLAKFGESIVVKDHAACRRDLHRGRLLAQPVAHRLERSAPPAAVADWIGRILGHRTREK